MQIARRLKLRSIFNFKFKYNFSDKEKFNSFVAKEENINGPAKKSNSLNENTNKQKQSSLSQDFFYNLDPTNIISLKEEEKSRMRSKLKYRDEKSPVLVEDETYRELYKNFSLYVGEALSQELDIIDHNEERNGQLFKYGLPAKNELPFNKLVVKDEVEENIPKTATENLFELMGLDSDSSYESLILKFQSEFNHGKPN